MTRAVVNSPRSQGMTREGREVRHQEHVGLGDAGEAGDRGAVDPLAAFDRRARRLGRDRHALDDAHDVGELEVDELDALVLDPGEDLVGGRALTQDGFADGVLGWCSHAKLLELG